MFKICFMLGLILPATFCCGQQISETNICQAKWKYHSLPDTLSGVVVYDRTAFVIKVAPENVPGFRVDIIPYDSKACQIKEAYFGRIIAQAF